MMKPSVIQRPDWANALAFDEIWQVVVRSSRGDVVLPLSDAVSSFTLGGAHDALVRFWERMRAEHLSDSDEDQWVEHWFAERLYFVARVGHDKWFPAFA